MINKLYRNFCLCVIFLTLFSGCLSEMKEGCDPKDRKIAFQTPDAQYKKEVLKDVSKYTKLKDFIIANLDTIYAYNEKKSFVTTEHVDGTSNSVKNHLDHFAFFDYGTGHMIKDQVPSYLYPQLKKIYRSFNKNSFFGVSFERDSTVSISVKDSEYNPKNVRIVHNLEWRNHKVVFETDTTNLSRDTTLANGWIYSIYIDCYEGI